VLEYSASPESKFDPAQVCLSLALSGTGAARARIAQAHVASGERYLASRGAESVC